MAQLRNPNGGCPWDLEQSFATIAKYTIEETYEVVEAIEKNDMQELKGELGDLLFQIVFYAQMAKEQNLFDFHEVAELVADKMVARHPHVFAKTENAETAGDVLNLWEANKAKERAEKSGLERKSALDGVITALPAITRALKLQQRAARVGFDWTNPEDILAKLHEEIGEVKQAMQEKVAQAIEEEIGDLLFVLVNLARRLEVDPESALRAANRKFERRFRAMEALLDAQSETMLDKSLDELETLWQRVKKMEKR